MVSFLLWKGSSYILTLYWGAYYFLINQGLCKLILRANTHWALAKCLWSACRMSINPCQAMRACADHILQMRRPRHRVRDLCKWQGQSKPRKIGLKTRALNCRIILLFFWPKVENVFLLVFLFSFLILILVCLCPQTDLVRYSSGRDVKCCQVVFSASTRWSYRFPPPSCYCAVSHLLICGYRTILASQGSVPLDNEGWLLYCWVHCASILLRTLLLCSSRILAYKFLFL